MNVDCSHTFPENPIVLDNGEPDDERNAATPDDNELTLEVTTSPDRCDSPFHSIRCSGKSVTIDVKDAQNCQTQNIMHIRVDGDKEEGKEVQDGMSSYNGNFTCALAMV
jgi:hypothetical protein